ncbi:hypothetical protein BsWGS_21946 [Bradybaena similaris]
MMKLLDLSSLLKVVLAVILGANNVSSENTQVYDICHGSRSNNVRISASSRPFLIRSPNFGQVDYYNRAICSLILWAGDSPVKLSFTFRYFQLESSRWCRYDALCVDGRLFCGNTAAGQVVVHTIPANRKSTIRFQTNNVNTDYGFDVRNCHQ